MDKLQRQYYLHLCTHKQMGMNLCNQRVDCDFRMVTYHFPIPPGSLTQQCSQDWKRSVFIPIPKKGNTKEYSNYHTIALISHTSKVMLKVLQARLHQYVNWELPEVQAVFRKSRGTRGQTANIPWIIEEVRELQKNIYFRFIDYAKTFDCVDHNKLWKFLQEMGKIFWEICM